MKKLIAFLVVFSSCSFFMVKEVKRKESKWEKVEINLAGINVFSESEIDLNADLIKEEVANNNLLVSLRVTNNIDERFTVDDDDLTSQEIDVAKMAFRSRMADIYSIHNLAYAKSMGLENMDNLHIGKYGPFIEFTIPYQKNLLTKTNNLISTLNNNQNIKQINIVEQQSMEITPMLGFARLDTYCYPGYDVGTLTGTGITVGLLDGGIIKTSHTNIKNSNYAIYSGSGQSSSLDHPTLMASIIGGNSGIAQKAKILSAQWINSPFDELTWMLDSGADIINISAGEGTNMGIYSFVSAQADFLAWVYKVAFIAAVGNEGENGGLMSNPAIGYNVLGVGASVNAFGDDGRLLLSSYIDNEGAQKPQIMAPGGMAIPNFSGSYAGTSLSTALVSGCAALLLEQYPILKARPEQLFAILMANSNKFTNSAYPYSLGCGLDDKIGSGLINFYRSRIEGFGKSSLFEGGNMGILGELSLSVSHGKKVRGAMFWFAEPYIGVNSQAVPTEYDLVFKSNSLGSNYKNVNSRGNNTKMFDVTITYADNYYIQAVQPTFDSYYEAIGIAYAIQ